MAAATVVSSKMWPHSAIPRLVVRTIEPCSYRARLHLSPRAYRGGEFFSRKTTIARKLAIAPIAVKRRRGRRLYCVAGSHEWTTNAATVAQAAVTAREARDARLLVTRSRREP
ncbi:MAG: hypothetical protein QOI48_3034 [Solirubrobacteraceae bacterium]|jgi:hypothetical protein|nr:hypothetical protein [Solirubrobacteraceae bacterium]